MPLRDLVPIPFQSRDKFLLDVGGERFWVSMHHVIPVETLGMCDPNPPPCHALHGLPSGKRAKIKVTDDLEISLNGEKSKNPGHISVTDGGPYKENTYYGRIDDNGTVYPAKAWTAEVLRCLEDFNTKNGGGESDDLPF